MNDMETQIDRLKEDSLAKKKKIDTLKEDLLEKEKKINDMKIQINKLKEDSSVREKEIKDINEILDIIKENLVCPIFPSFFSRTVRGKRSLRASKKF